MFTGIIEELGSVKSIRKGSASAMLCIEAPGVLADTRIGDSIATNGVCLTVTSNDGSCFAADVMHETLRRSSLGQLVAGSKVNLERAMALGDRFGGHIVSGHIDGTGKIVRIERDDNAFWYSISAPQNILRLVIEKGSIAIDGISLTVAAAEPDSFKVSVIPHTRAVTNLGSKKAGDTVNLENDVIGKYVEALMRAQEHKANEPSGLSLDYLAANGF